MNNVQKINKSIKLKQNNDIFGRNETVPTPAWLLIPVYFKTAWLTLFFHYIRGVNCILMELQSQSRTQMLPDVWWTGLWAQAKKKKKKCCIPVVFFNQKLHKEHDLNVNLKWFRMSFCCLHSALETTKAARSLHFQRFIIWQSHETNSHVQPSCLRAQQPRRL